MSDPSPPDPPLPSGWPRNVKSAVLHVIYPAQFAIVATRGWAADALNPRTRQAAENDQVKQENLARHSSPMLTLGRYAHTEIAGHSKALDALPDLEPAKDTPDDQEAKKTGTYDGRAETGIARQRACNAPDMA